jgi:hypothetical protein
MDQACSPRSPQDQETLWEPYGGCFWEPSLMANPPIMRLGWNVNLVPMEIDSFRQDISGMQSCQQEAGIFTRGDRRRKSEKGVGCKESCLSDYVHYFLVS